MRTTYDFDKPLTFEDSFDDWLVDELDEAIDEALDKIAPAIAIGAGGLILSGANTIMSLLGSSGRFIAEGPLSVSYMRRNPRPNFKRKVCQFSLIVYDPPGTKELWFQLSYETNGKDLCDIRLQCLPRKSPSLILSSLKINFVVDQRQNSPTNAEIAQVVYRLNGTWDPALAYSYTFSGNLIIRADNPPRLQILSSEENTVRIGKIQYWETQSSGTCSSSISTPRLSRGGSPAATASLPILRRGSRGSAVKLLQQRLNRWLSRQPGQRQISEDGVFGTGTEVAVKNFQGSQKIKVDGVVGSVTWNLLPA